MKHVAAPVFIASILISFSCGSDAARAPAGNEPLTVLLITGGGWHDYAEQARILMEGIGERTGAVFTVDHSAGEESDGGIARHENTGWAREFDLVLYNMCFIGMRDPEWSQRIVAAHVEYNVPAVLLHCAMHSYNYQGDNETWHRFAGVRTYDHQSHMPYTVETLATEHPIMAGFPDAWTTPQGELYNIREVFETATPLAHAFGEDTGEYHVNVWTNEYGGVRVFGTTIGHHNETMGHEHYLNLVSNGLLWAAGRLEHAGALERDVQQ
jgi:uncharacterized protein